MSNAAGLQALIYEAESIFGEDVVTFATHRIVPIGAVDLSGIKQLKIDSGRVTQYLQDGTAHILGPMEGSFSITQWMHGHGATTAGSPSIDALETWLGTVLGSAALSASTSTTASAGSATAWTTASSGAFTAGGLVRLGVLNDAKGNGQMFPISTCVTTTLTNLFASDAAPTSADVVYPVVHFHLPEDPTAAATSIAGTRWLVRTANSGVELHGCFPTGFTLSGLNAGEIPKCVITYGVAWWRYSAITGPSVVTANQYNAAPIAAGSFVINDVGTATRTKRTIRGFSVDVALNTIPLMGQGGANAYQMIIGAKRGPATIGLQWTEDCDAATATPVLDGYFTASGATRKHIMWTGSTTAGSAIGIYFPSICFVGPRPMIINDGGINRFTVQAMAYRGATTTSELTLSAMRIGYA